MNYGEAFLKLEPIHQTHLLDFWKELHPHEQIHLLKQIAGLDKDLFLKQQQVLKQPLKEPFSSFEPFQDFSLSGSSEHFSIGQKAISEGEVGCLIVAGGQGTRLKLEGPKGLYPISNIKKKSLFQLFAEKTVAASRQASQILSLAIMSSPLNHQMTQTYFEAHNLFGLKKKQLDIFPQNMLPFLDDGGNLFLEDKGSIAFGPDGNGSALHNFWNQGIGPKWKAQGVKYVNFVLIDNPLADPFDAELIGFHIQNQNTITVKCTKKNFPEEKVGVLIKHEGKVKVIEYTELPENERNATLSNGTLKHGCANISLFCFNLSFIEKLCENHAQLPLHPAYKSSKSLLHGEQKAWKFEHFIFDVLPEAEKVQALLYPRETCFAPLKSLTGEGSPASVQAALFHQDQLTYEKIFNKKAPQHIFELSQEFYYPTSLFIEKWQNKPFPNDHYLGP